MSTDQGRELAKSSHFCLCIAKYGYTLEMRGAGASFKNAIAKRYHCTLADMTPTILSSAYLSLDYLSITLWHAVSIKKCLLYRADPGHITHFQHTRPVTLTPPHPAIWLTR